MPTSPKLAVLVLALAPIAGCATTKARSTPAPRVAEAALVADDGVAPTFPTRLTRPSTPRAADRLAHRVAAELGGRARADLRVCVGGDGAVTDAAVVRTSGIAALDRALLADARTWRYQARAARTAPACQRVGIDYKLP
ncbi:MAG: TonB family protein [Myxococcales bacterium]|nr:TonB family protein [Myxococcales bacterium]